MRRILAALWFSIKSAGQNFRRNLGVSLAGVFTMGLILFLVGGALLFTHSVNSILQAQQANASKIKIYLSDSASLASIADFQTRLQHDPRVISVSFESKDQAAKEASQDPDIQQALSTLGSNPLPASLNLDIKQGEFFAFLGPNAAGKTTTIKMLTGLIRPSTGNCIVASRWWWNTRSRNAALSRSVGVSAARRCCSVWRTLPHSFVA